MKNKRNTNKKVVEFPNLKQRLLEKAMQAMKEKKFSEALVLFEQARENEYAYAEVELGMVVCYMELGQLTEAKNRCKKMLREDVGDYFHVLQIYITILIQLKEYGEVKTTIEAIMEEDRLPAQYAQNFYQLLEFARKMLPGTEEEQENVKESPVYTDSDQLDGVEPTEQSEIAELLSGSIQRQYEIIQLLKHRNIRPLIWDIEKYLVDEQKHPVLKTFLLHILKEQGWDKNVQIVKLGDSISVIPKDLPEGNEDPFLNKVITLLEDSVESDNPILFESLKEMLVRIHTVQFPFPFQPKEQVVWAAGLHKVGSKLFGISLSKEEVVEKYNIDETNLEHVTDKITRLEDFSYLQL